MESSSSIEVQDALSLIEDAQLPHPSGGLLRSFVTEALDSVSAARYVKDKLAEGHGRTVVSDWIYVIESISRTGHRPPAPDASARRSIALRDGNRCCITGKAGTWRDPLVVSPILPVPVGWLTDKPRIHQLLGVFFGPRYRDWWLAYARDPARMRPYSNHWLVRESAAKVFEGGFVRLQRLQPSMVEYEVDHIFMRPERPLDLDGAYPLLGDHSRTRIETVDARFLGTHARLSTSVQFVEIAKKVAPEILTDAGDSPIPTPIPVQPHTSSYPRPVTSGRGFRFSDVLTGALLGSWLMFPRNLRIAVYEQLRKMGARRYGKPSGALCVQELPGGFYLKFQGEPEETGNEFSALQIVSQHTSIPVPRPLDMVVREGNKDDPFSSPSAYLLMTKIPGEPLSACQYLMADKDLEQIAVQLQDYLSQLREIPKTSSSSDPEVRICNTLRKACRDPRVCGAQPVGPFADEASFSQSLRFSDEPSRRGHKIVFTHADLNPRNILVQQVTRPDGLSCWEVSGIVDWECAGYYPEYWDYTKALFEGFRWPRRYNDWVKRVFAVF